MPRTVAVVLVGFSMLIAACGDDDLGRVATTAATTVTTGATSTTGSGITAATVPPLDGGCAVEATGTDPISWTGPNDISAFTTDYWYTEDELRQQWEFVGDPTLGAFEERIASGLPVFTFFLFNCQGTEQALVSLYVSDATTRTDFPLGPGTYPIRAGFFGGGDLGPAEFAVIFSPNATEVWGFDGEGVLNITEWSGERVVGNFAFNVVEQFSDTPGSVSVLVSFEMTCQASAQC
ncbi:MAG: hypothetical protein AAB198_01945 [Actinomycetota bacterium]